MVRQNRKQSGLHRAVSCLRAPRLNKVRHSPQRSAMHWQSFTCYLNWDPRLSAACTFGDGCQQFGSARRVAQPAAGASALGRNLWQRRLRRGGSAVGGRGGVAGGAHGPGGDGHGVVSIHMHHLRAPGEGYIPAEDAIYSKTDALIHRALAGAGAKVPDIHMGHAREHSNQVKSHSGTI